MSSQFEEFIATVTPQLPVAAKTTHSTIEAVSLIRCDDDGELLRITIPYSISPSPRRDVLAPETTIEHAKASDSWTLITRGADEESRFRSAQGVFTRQGNRPTVPPFALAEYQAPEDPKIACVIVLNENDRYVRQCLVPSLLGHESGSDLEVLIVSNGSHPLDRVQETFHPIRVIESEWGPVARAYQTGADATSADILAFLHDDCMASHGRWVELAADALENDVGIVSQQIIKFNRSADLIGRTTPDLPHPKAIPMVMTRENLTRFGGWDVQHFIGFEELDLALASLDVGLDVRQLDAGFIHDAGHSTILKYLINTPHLRDAFALGAIPIEVVHQMQGMAIKNILSTRIGEKIRQDLLLHVLRRHAPALVRLGMNDVDGAIEDLERIRAQDGSILDDWETMAKFDRDLAHQTQARSRDSRSTT